MSSGSGLMIFAQGASRATSARLLAMKSEAFIISKTIPRGSHGATLFMPCTKINSSGRVPSGRPLGASARSRPPLAARLRPCGRQSLTQHHVAADAASFLRAPPSRAARALPPVLAPPARAGAPQKSCRGNFNNPFRLLPRVRHVAEVQQQLHLITTKGAQTMIEKLDVYSRVTDKIIADL